MCLERPVPLDRKVTFTPLSRWGILLIPQHAWTGVQLMWGGGGGTSGLLKCRYGSRLISGWSSHCQAWWKPNAAVSNFINIVAGGTCWTCLLSPLQMVGNVPDLHTPPGASTAGAPQPMQLIPLTPLCVYCVCMNVHLCLSVYINCHMATWVFLYPSPFFSSATHSLPHGAVHFPPINKKLRTWTCCISPMV